MFLEVFYHSLFLSFVLNLFFNVLSLFLCWKQGSKSFASSLRLSCKSRSWKIYFWHFCHQTESFASSLWVTCELATREIPRLVILWVFHEFLVQNFSYDSLVTPSSPNPLFQSFYIKTQLISSVLHFINISKIIFNTFNCF